MIQCLGTEETLKVISNILDRPKLLTPSRRRSCKSLEFVLIVTEHATAGVVAMATVNPELHLHTVTQL